MDISNPAIIIKIQLLQESQAKNYFETKERLFLQTILTKIENKLSYELNINDKEKNMLKTIFKKYEKYL